jgi:hypothetical protein
VWPVSRTYRYGFGASLLIWGLALVAAWFLLRYLGVFHPHTLWGWIWWGLTLLVVIGLIAWLWRTAGLGGRILLIILAIIAVVLGWIVPLTNTALSGAQAVVNSTCTWAGDTPDHCSPAEIAKHTQDRVEAAAAAAAASAAATVPTPTPGITPSAGVTPTPGTTPSPDLTPTPTPSGSLSPSPTPGTCQAPPQLTGRDVSVTISADAADPMAAVMLDALKGTKAKAAVYLGGDATADQLGTWLDQAASDGLAGVIGIDQIWAAHGQQGTVDLMQQLKDHCNFAGFLSNINLASPDGSVGPLNARIDAVKNVVGQNVQGWALVNWNSPDAGDRQAYLNSVTKNATVKILGLYTYKTAQTALLPAAGATVRQQDGLQSTVAVQAFDGSDNGSAKTGLPTAQDVSNMVSQAYRGGAYNALVVMYVNDPVYAAQVVNAAGTALGG